MNESYNLLFDEHDLLEENPFQWVYTGKEKKPPHHKVLIHKFKKNDQFNEAFKELIDTLQNKCHIEEIDDTIVLVTRDLEGDNISLHLNFSNTSSEERLDYLYDYLHQAVAYIGFDPYLFNILVSGNQVVFLDGKLYLREKIVLDRRIDQDLPFSMVAKNMGQVMQRILITNYNELRTSIKYDQLYNFTESLIRREKDYLCFDDLFHDFKAIYFGKLERKRKPLHGQAHPNNIFLESIPEQKEAPAPLPSMEVTDEERALLTGISYDKEEEVQEDFDQEEPTETYQPTPSQEQVSINYDQPFEESLDLSKLKEGDQTLEELFVRSQPDQTSLSPKKNRQLKPVAPEDQPDMAEAPEEPFRDEPFEEATKIIGEIPKEDQPVFGVPEYLKEDKQESRPSSKNKRGLPFHWSIPLIAVLILALLTGGAYSVIKFINRPEPISKPPIAKFEARIEGDKLICINQSEAFGDATIHSSTWVLYKNDEKIHQLEGKKKAGFNVSNLTEGIYTIQLTVTDSDFKSSAPERIVKEYISSESRANENKVLSEQSSTRVSATQHEYLDDYSTSLSENIQRTSDRIQSGQYAYKIDPSLTTSHLMLNNLKIKPGSTLSFWVMKEDDSPIEVQISALSQGRSNFDKTLVTKVDSPGEWKIISLQLSLKADTDYIILTFPQGQSSLYLDDIKHDTYK